MLKILRKKGVMKRILWFLAVIIILAFGFMGQASRLSNTRRTPYAGRINGRKVSLEEFQKHYQHVQIQALIQYGRNLNKFRDILNLERETWDRIIALDEAHKRRIKINDDEVLSALLNHPLFQKDNHFDKELYNTTLRYAFKITPKEFEESLRDSLKLVRLYDQVTGDLSVSEQEVFKQYTKENEKVQVHYVLFKTEKYKDQVIYNEEAVASYYNNHKTKFLQPPQIKVAYIHLDFPAEARDEENDIIEQQAIDIYQQLIKNPDLESVAAHNELNLETTGFFSMEKPVLKQGWSYPLVQELFQFDIGQISELLETEQGFQILSLKEKLPATIPDFTEAKELVEEAWRTEEAQEISKEKALEYLNFLTTQESTMKKDDFIEIAKSENLEIQQTPIFTRGQYLPTVGITKGFQENAFNLDENNRMSGVVETPKGYAILFLDTKYPVNMEDFQDQKDEWAQKVIVQKKTEAFNDFISRLRIKSKLEDRIPELLSKSTTANQQRNKD